MVKMLVIAVDQFSEAGDFVGEETVEEQAEEEGGKEE